MRRLFSVIEKHAASDGINTAISSFNGVSNLFLGGSAQAFGDPRFVAIR
ncbi:hypothetical protein [Leucobacter sp. OH1287]|nr:hypothetical protein [Leucobacter sp. OH1287]